MNFASLRGPQAEAIPSVDDAIASLPSVARNDANLDSNDLIRILNFIIKPLNFMGIPFLIPRIYLENLNV